MWLRVSVFAPALAVLAACASTPAENELDLVQCGAVGKLGLAIAASKGEELAPDHVFPLMTEYYTTTSQIKLGLSESEAEKRVADRAVEINQAVDVFTDPTSFRNMAEPCVRNMVSRGKL